MLMMATLNKAQIELLTALAALKPDEEVLALKQAVFEFSRYGLKFITANVRKKSFLLKKEWLEK